jgi:ABC-type multidrug transport system ATPase subunit
VIETEGLTKRFGDKLAVDGLSLRVEAGEVMGFLGPNGSGKTTTIRLLMGLLRPSTGRASILGRDCHADTRSPSSATSVTSPTSRSSTPI